MLVLVFEEEICVIISVYMYNVDKDYGVGVVKLVKVLMFKVC